MRARSQLLAQFARVVGISPSDPSLQQCALDGDINSAMLEALAGRGFAFGGAAQRNNSNNGGAGAGAKAGAEAEHDSKHAQRKESGCWSEMEGVLGAVRHEQVAAQLRSCIEERGPARELAHAKVNVVYPESESAVHERKGRASTLATLTLVSGFFDLGEVRWGSKFSEENYLHWMRPLGSLDNPLLFFSDAPLFVQELLLRRAHLQEDTSASISMSTQAFLMNRSSLRSFRLYLNATRTVLERTPLPYVKWPNMMVPEYCLTMHAKYDLLALAIALSRTSRSHQSSHIAWVDVGYWRDIQGNGERFRLLPPPELHPQRVGFTEVFQRDWTGVGME